MCACVGFAGLATLRGGFTDDVARTGGMEDLVKVRA
jgi:hypothetical protein